MAFIPAGVYSISRSGNRLLTFEHGAEKGSPAVLLPPTGQPGIQEWEVRIDSNGNVTIRNLQSQTYLGYEADPQLNMPVGSYPEPREWALYQSAEPFTFHVVVPGGPIEGRELTLDESLLRIYPPRIALRPLDVHDLRQPWRFEFHE
ncbi:hypothetical protein [Nocardia sp. NBC_00403]|uniref:hypothetical protein n=1 Tax=Nocardia sp. NBC_00403 TaxID=2975990 RepID=UPI002E1D1FE9